MLELRSGHWGSDRGSMVNRSLVVSFVDGNGGMSDSWNNGFLLNDRLDGLVVVMVDVLTNDGRSDGLSVLGVGLGDGVRELGLLSGELLLNLALVVVVKGALFNRSLLHDVLLRLHLIVLDRLNGGVVVVLVLLLLNNGANVFVVALVDMLMLDRRCNALFRSDYLSASSRGSLNIAGVGRFGILVLLAAKGLVKSTILPSAMLTRLP